MLKSMKILGCVYEFCIYGTNIQNNNPVQASILLSNSLPILVIFVIRTQSSMCIMEQVFNEIKAEKKFAYKLILQYKSVWFVFFGQIKNYRSTLHCFFTFKGEMVSVLYFKGPSFRLGR